MLPNRISLSTKATSKLQSMKQYTGLTPNILARVGIMLAINEGSNLKNAGVSDNDGQTLNRDVLFGDHAQVYDVLIQQYIYEQKLELPTAEVITSLIEIGVHKMGHVKSIEDLVFN